MPAAARYTAIALLTGYCLWFLAGALGVTAPGTHRRAWQQQKDARTQARLALEATGVSAEAIDEHLARLDPQVAAARRTAQIVDTVQLAGFLGALILLRSFALQRRHPERQTSQQPLR